MLLTMVNVLINFALHYILCHVMKYSEDRAVIFFNR